MGVKPRLEDTVGKEFKPFVSDTDRVVSNEKQQALRDIASNYFESVAAALLKENENLKKAEQDNHQTMATKGELSEEQKSNYEKIRSKFEKLFNLTTRYFLEPKYKLP